MSGDGLISFKEGEKEEEDELDENGEKVVYEKNLLKLLKDVKKNKAIKIFLKNCYVFGPTKVKCGHFLIMSYFWMNFRHILGNDRSLDLWHFPIYNVNSFKNMWYNLRGDIKLSVALCPYALLNKIILNFPTLELIVNCWFQNWLEIS